MDFTLKDLKKWNSSIESLVQSEGLNCYPQEFELINYDEMLSYEAYSGMPSRYPHWSFGKSYEKNKILYSYNLTGIAYEIVINSNPCLAFLLKNNTLLLQILTMAHVYGHNDFFKNNRLFTSYTDADSTIEMVKRNTNLIRSYISNPSIGLERVERVLDAAHALRFQVTKFQIAEAIDKDDQAIKEDLLLFIIKNGQLDEWAKNILEIVRNETIYFTPQIETKIINEGWASYWHYNILKKLELPQGMHIEFLKRHNDVVKPIPGAINPYHIGFLIFNSIEKNYGRDKLFEVRKMERDFSFIKKYLTEDICHEANLFQYFSKDQDYYVGEISDKSGWKIIRDTLSSNCGMGKIPVIQVVEVNPKNKKIIVEHKYEGRELLITYAKATLKYLKELWGHEVELKTIIGGKETVLKGE